MVRACMLCAASLVLALSIGGGFSIASASGVPVKLEAGGRALSNGERGFLDLELEHPGIPPFSAPPIVGPGVFCGAVVVANIVENSLPSVKVKETPPLWEEEGCPGLNYPMFSGVFRGATFNSTGLGKAEISRVSLTVPGPCVYALHPFEGTFSIPGPARFEGTSHGRLIRGKRCPRTRPVPFTVTFLSETPGFVPFTTSF